MVAVRSAAQLKALSSAPKKKSVTVCLEIAGLSEDQTARWESAVNQYLNECGCSLGAKFALLGMAVSVLYQFTYSSWSFWRLPVFFGRSLALAVMVGAAGKLIGLKIAARGIRGIIDELAHHEHPASRQDPQQ